MRMRSLVCGLLDLAVIEDAACVLLVHFEWIDVVVLCCALHCTCGLNHTASAEKTSLSLSLRYVNAHRLGQVALVVRLLTEAVIAACRLRCCMHMWTGLPLQVLKTMQAAQLECGPDDYGMALEACAGLPPFDGILAGMSAYGVSATELTCAFLCPAALVSDKSCRVGCDVVNIRMPCLDGGAVISIEANRSFAC